jgi:hypothetical protein
MFDSSLELYQMCSAVGYTKPIGAQHTKILFSIRVICDQYDQITTSPRLELA